MKLKTTRLSPPQKLLNNLLVHFQKGRFDEAEKLALFITKKFPRHQFAFKVLGAVLRVTGRKSEALNANKKSVVLSPYDAEAQSNLGVTLQDLGNFKEAEASFTQAIALNPNYAEAHCNLGNTLKELGRLDEARSSYAQAIALKPDYARAHYNLGTTLHELGKMSEAEATYNQVIAIDPNYFHAYNNLGNVLKILGRLEEAEACYNRAIVLKPDYADAYYNLANMLKELGRLGEAESNYNQAIALKPDHAVAQNNLGNILKELGRLDEAKSSYNQAIALKPDYAEAHRHLSSIKNFDRQDEQYSKMHDLYLDENLSEEQLCHINFGLAKACEDLGDFDQAFTHYSEGNQLRKKLLNYDINQDIELFKRIKSNYHQIKYKALQPEKLPKKLTPIFIVGMPRSGTTLVEQIISSNSQVTGAGELSYVADFGTVIANGFSKVNHESLLDFRHKYLEKLQIVSNGNLIVSDKMPQNFLYIGLLAATFPEAKIVHVKRNPPAVCWSNYKHYFVSNNLGYCYALDDIVSYHSLYENLMDFWTNMLSEKFYNLDYELLIVNQKSETRQLIDYLGLDWDEKYLSPQNNTRRVATASNLQVREKVYQGSSQQWKKYQALLNGVFDDLLSPLVEN